MYCYVSIQVLTLYFKVYTTNKQYILWFINDESIQALILSPSGSISVYSVYMH